jgi:hypothetical protein
MRLGALFLCVLAEGSFARNAYGSPELSERHRHRYEFNREYEDILTSAAMRIAGRTTAASTWKSARSRTTVWCSWAASSSRVQVEARSSRTRCSAPSSGLPSSSAS